MCLNVRHCVEVVERSDTAPSMKFPIKDFFSYCDQIHCFLRIWSHLLKKPSMEKPTFFVQCDHCHSTMHCYCLKRKLWWKIKRKKYNLVDVVLRHKLAIFPWVVTSRMLPLATLAQQKKFFCPLPLLWRYWPWEITNSKQFRICKRNCEKRVLNWLA